MILEISGSRNVSCYVYGFISFNLISWVSLEVVMGVTCEHRSNFPCEICLLPTPKGTSFHIIELPLNTLQLIIVMVGIINCDLRNPFMVSLGLVTQLREKKGSGSQRNIDDNESDTYKQE